MIVDLTVEEWNRLLNAAALAPYAQIAPIISKVVAQCNQQEANNGKMESNSKALHSRDSVRAANEVGTAGDQSVNGTPLS
jgi:hypothetical protein